MNYYSNQEIEQVIEEADRQPRPATSHVALTTPSAARPRKDRTTLKAGIFALAVFLFVLIANIFELPAILLALFAGMLIGIFAYMTIKGDDNVRRH
jgi:hypothetical protein